MTMRSWIHTLFNRPVTRAIRKAPHRSRPALEALEDRSVPSTFVVNNPTDTPVSGETDLRQAVVEANSAGGANTITFDSTVFSTPQTITLNGSQLELSDTSGTETITGPAAHVTVSGGGLSRVFQIDGGVTASISGLTITGGNSSGSVKGNGGGLYNAGTATLTNCTVSGNTATVGENSAHAGSGGGLYNAGTATLINCTVSGNTATEGLGGSHSGNGGGLFNHGTAVLLNCTISGNTASGNNGGGYDGFGGGLYNAGTATLTNCTVNGNTAYGNDAPFDGGGGLENEGTATLINCTVSGNVGYFGGGVCNGVTATLIDCTLCNNSATVPNAVTSGGGMFNSGTATLTNCTITNNSSTGYDGVGLSTFDATATLINTIVAGQGNAGNVYGSLTSASSNNLIGGNPMLAPLGDYGGPTQTMPPLPGSPAIGQGIIGSGIPTTDQRGLPRPPAGPITLGADEYNTADPTQSFVTISSSTVLSGGTATVTLHPIDPLGTNHTTGGLTIAFGLSGGTSGGSFSTVTEQTNGTYTATFPATAAGTASTITATLNGAAVTTTLPAVTVNPASPAITATPSAATVTLGTSSVTLKDTAVLSGGYSPTGTITFTLYLGTTEVDTETASVNGDGSYTTPAGYTLTSSSATGTYQWDATYGGDTNNHSISDNNDSKEQVVVSPSTPSVVKTQIDDGTAQRSMVRSITLTFSGSIASTLATVMNELSLTRVSDSLSVGLQGTLNSSGTVLTLTFTGSSVIGGSLADGRYNLCYDGTTVLNSTQLWRLFGDLYGTASVTAADETAFLAALNSRKGMSNYSAYFDFNEAGDIVNYDETEFMLRLGTSI